MRLPGAIAVSLWAMSLYAAPPLETAVFDAFRGTDASLSHFIELQRTGVGQ
jgi:hypothetical protein